MEFLPELAARARGFASTYHVDVDANMGDREHSAPILMPLDDHGRPLLHIHEPNGVDFYLSRIDHFKSDYHVAASQLISMVMPGYRTRSAYLPKDRRTRVVEIHYGVGYLILGRPLNDDEDFTTTTHRLDPKVTPFVAIPPDHFFTFEATPGDTGENQPLVISEVFAIHGERELESTEIVLDPGQDLVELPDGPVVVPEDFSEGIFT